MTISNFSISLTDKVLQHYAKLQKKHSDKIGLRLSVKKAGCSGWMYQSEWISSQSDDDCLVFSSNEIKVFVSRKSIPYLEGITIDFVEKGLGQSQVTYHNPREVARCGCGESFKVEDSQSQKH